MVTFLELPEDVKRIILEYLNAETLMRSMRVNRSWRNTIKGMQIVVAGECTSSLFSHLLRSLPSLTSLSASICVSPPYSGKFSCDEDALRRQNQAKAIGCLSLATRLQSLRLITSDIPSSTLITLQSLTRLKSLVLINPIIQYAPLVPVAGAFLLQLSEIHIKGFSLNKATECFLLSNLNRYTSVCLNGDMKMRLNTLNELKSYLTQNLLNVYHEICQTEQGFLADLKTLESALVIMKEQSLINAAQFQLFYHALPSILQCGELFYNAIRSHHSKLFSAFLEHEAYFRELSRRAPLMGLISRESISQEAKQFFASRPATRGIPLEAFLVNTPIGRLCKYPLLVKVALDCEEIDSPFFADGQKALLMIEKIVQEASKNTESLIK